MDETSYKIAVKSRQLLIGFQTFPVKEAQR